MTIADIQQKIASPEGFARAVAHRRGIYMGGLGALIAGALGIGMNLFQLGTASDGQWSLMFRYFFDAQAVEFTGFRAGRAEVWRYVYVWAPVVLIPLGIILLIVHLATKSTAGAHLFSNYQHRGWVGRQLLPGLRAKNGSTQVDVALISHPSVPDHEFFEAVQRYSAYLATLDKKGKKAASAAVARQNLQSGMSAAVLAPDLPPAILAAPVQGKGSFVVVVPPETPGRGAVQILPVRE